MAIFYTDETALEFWQWHASTGSVLELPKRSRLSRLASQPSTVGDIRAAAECFHRSDEPLHVMALSSNVKRHASDIKFHFFSGILPNEAFFRLNQDAFVASPEYIFVQLANKLNLTELLLLGCEMTGTYYRNQDDTRGFSKIPPLTSVEKLSRFVKRCNGIDGVKKARRASSYLIGNAASPMEAEAALMVSLPKALGGYGLPKPSLNHPLPLSAEQQSSMKRESIIADMLWTKGKVAVEYDSNQWHSGNDKFIKDSKRRNDILSLGYHVQSITFDEISSIVSMDSICETLRKTMKLRKSADPSNYPNRKLRLKTQFADIRRRAYADASERASSE